MKYSLLFFGFFCTFLTAQPTVDGDISDGSYATTLATYSTGRDGFGSDNDLGVLKYFQNGTDIYLGLSCEVNENNNVIIFFNFSGYTGRGSNTLTSATSGGVLNNIGSAKMDMDVDFALAFNEGNGTTNFYLDAARYGSSGHVSSGYIGSTSDQSGTSVSLDLGTTFGGTGNIQFAYNNNFSGNSNKGLEMKIPIAAFAGVTNSQTLSVFVVITSSAGFFANECLPGDPGSSNPGSNWDATSVSGQDFFTAGSAMPVELTSFTALQKGKGIELQWQTSSETNNHGFEIERTLSGTGSWEKIGFRQGHGSCNCVNTYSFADNTAGPGKFLYRLKQIDRDGQFEYSGTVEATIGLSPTVASLRDNYPNPFNPNTSISFILGSAGRATVKVYDLLGKEIALIADGVFSAGEVHSFPFSAHNLTSGIYYYRLTTEHSVQTKKMILMK